METTKFRVIPLQTYEPKEIAVLDKILLEGVEAGLSPPTLIYYTWKNKSISLSIFQSLEDVDVSKARKEGYEIVRMYSGGDAVFHHETHDFSYSLFMPKHLARIREKGNPLEIYAHYCGKIINAFENIGIKSRLDKNSGIYVNNSKVCGNASKVMKNTIMVQGIIIYKMPEDSIVKNMINIMTQYSMSDYTELRKILSGLDQYIENVNINTVINEMTRTLTYNNYELASLTRKETQLIKKRMQKYDEEMSLVKGKKRGLCWMSRREE